MSAAKKCCGPNKRLLVSDWARLAATPPFETSRMAMPKKEPEWRISVFCAEYEKSHDVEPAE